MKDKNQIAFETAVENLRLACIGLGEIKERIRIKLIIEEFGNNSCGFGLGTDDLCPNIDREELIKKIDEVQP